VQRETELVQTARELMQGGTSLDTEVTAAGEGCKAVATRGYELATSCVGLAPTCATAAQCIAEPDQRLRWPR